MISLRAFSPSDARVVASWIDSLEALVVWSGTSGFTWPFEGEQLTRFAAAEPSRRLQVAVDESGEVVGHLMLRDDGDHVRLGLVIVSPAARGHGYGEAMIVQALALAFAPSRVTSVTLGVYTHNTGAMRLYERLGFRGEGVGSEPTQVGQSSWEAVTMRLRRESWRSGALST